MPLGAFLSGGVDSTIVVGLMRQLSAGPLRTFSIGFPVPEYDETHYARMAAQRFQTIHEEFRVEPKAVEVLPRLVWHFDEPFADSSALPTWYLAELTRQHVTVALTGDGGDELFAGYPHYGAAWLGDCSIAGRRARGWLSAPIGSDSLVVPPEVPPAAVETLRRRLFPSAGTAVSEWISIFGEARRAWLYREEHLARLPDADPLDSYPACSALAAATP